MAARPVFNPQKYLARTGGTLTGNLLFSADNTYDIGASGATRPRHIYAGTNINAGGVITGTGGVISEGAIRVDVNSQLYWNGSTTLKPTADGTLTVANNATTAGFTMDGTTDTQVKLSNRANNATAVLRVGTFAAGAGETFSGTITIKDWGGTDRKLAVFA